MSHPEDPTLAATLRQARSRSWGQARPLRTHYLGPNALRQVSAGRLVVESARAENTALSDEQSTSRRHVVADELERRGLDESAAAARWAWGPEDESRARTDHEDALRHSRRPVSDDPELWRVAAGIVATAALVSTSEALLASAVDDTVGSGTVDGEPRTVLDGDPTIGLSPSELATDIGSVSLGPAPGRDVAPGVVLGDQFAAADPATRSDGMVAPAATASVEVGGRPDLD